MKDLTILLTGAGAPGAPGIIKCLRSVHERKIKIVGVDMNPYPSGRGLVDAFYVVPPASSSSFISEILTIAIAEKVDIIIPIVTRELYKFSISKQMFKEHGITVSVLDQNKLEIVNDKANLLTTLREKGIKTPHFIVVQSINEFESACKTLEYPRKPICVKQATGNGSRGIRFIDKTKSRYDLFINEKPNSMYISYEELLLTLHEADLFPKLVVMEFLPGEEYTVDVLALDGQIEKFACRHNARMLTGNAVESVLKDNKEVLQLVKAICMALKLDGNIGFDIKHDKDGVPQIMEINPRLSGGIVAAAAAGTNLLYMGIKQLLNEPFDKNCSDYDGFRMIRRWEEVFYDKQGKNIDF